MLVVLVTAADLSDCDGARLLLRRGCGFGQKLRLIWVDGAYRGSLQTWVAQRFCFRLRPVLRPQEQQGFPILPRRWVVECTFAWLRLNQRICKDYDRLPATSVALIHIAMVHLIEGCAHLIQIANLLAHRNLSDLNSRCKWRLRRRNQFHFPTEAR